jgi:hypothetical protein
MEDERSKSDVPFVAGLVIVQEHVVQVLLREYNLENDSNQYERVCDLISAWLSRDQCRYKECHGVHREGK